VVEYIETQLRHIQEPTSHVGTMLNEASFSPIFSSNPYLTKWIAANLVSKGNLDSDLVRFWQQLDTTHLPESVRAFFSAIPIIPRESFVYRFLAQDWARLMAERIDEENFIPNLVDLDGIGLLLAPPTRQELSSFPLVDNDGLYLTEMVQKMIKKILTSTLATRWECWEEWRVKLANLFRFIFHREFASDVWSQDLDYRPDDKVFLNTFSFF
jgi:hypothetical protein